jgi:hypothetical protein
MWIGNVDAQFDLIEPGTHIPPLPCLGRRSMAYIKALVYATYEISEGCEIRFEA